jgi:hypothetical protein
MSVDKIVGNIISKKESIEKDFSYLRPSYAPIDEFIARTIDVMLENAHTGFWFSVSLGDKLIEWNDLIYYEFSLVYTAINCNPRWPPE